VGRTRPLVAAAYPVHPAVARARARLLIVFCASPFDPGEFADARRELAALLETHHPVSSRPLMQRDAWCRKKILAEMEATE
jgi:hypothetical protein